MKRERVLITGASGYLGSYCILSLMNLSTANDDSLELVKVDLLDESDTWRGIVKDCDYVLHVASPSEWESNGDKLIKIAVQGTINILTACKDESKIKRVVITSSLKAIAGDPYDENNCHVFNESDWSDPDLASSVVKSIILAERAAWDFMIIKPDDGTDVISFELCAVNPGLIFGPVVRNQRVSPDSLAYRLMTRDLIMLPSVRVAAIDVRDVAMSHYKAMLVPEAAGHRHIVINDTLWYKDIATILDEEFRVQGYTVPLREIPHVVVSVLSWMKVKRAQRILDNMQHKHIFDTSRMKAVLDIDPIPLKQSLLDEVYAMIEYGSLERPQDYASNERYNSKTY